MKVSRTAYTAIACAVVLGAVAFLFPVQASSVAWNAFRLPSAALFLNEDAELAGRIGEYYFNAEGSGVYDIEKAERFYRKALEHDSYHPFARHQIARIEFLRGDFDDAIETINTQIALHGDDVVASHYVRGLIYGFRGDFDRAERDFLKFIEAKPENWGGYNDLAWIYFQKGEYEDAERYSRKGLELAPKSPWLLTTHGMALFNLGMKEEARAELETALDALADMTPSDWLNSNPGNDPRIAEEGLAQMTEAIERNLPLFVDN